MSEIRKIFAANLKDLIKTAPSIAHVCRQTATNRQQFNRYISGETLPSEHNLGKIAKYFSVSEAVLFKERANGSMPSGSADPFFNRLNIAFETLQDHISDGRYYFYLPSPGAGQHCLRGLFLLARNGDQLRVGGIICASSLAEPTRFNSMSRFAGLARELDGHVMILTSFKEKPGDLMLFNLMPVPTGHSQFFSGISTSTRAGMVLARRMAIERLPDGPRLLTLARKCGVVGLDGPDIDPWIRAAVGADDGDWALFMQPKSFSAIVNNFTGDTPAP
jgi:hypothetical protein